MLMTTVKRLIDRSEKLFGIELVQFNAYSSVCFLFLLLLFCLEHILSGRNHVGDPVIDDGSYSQFLLSQDVVGVVVLCAPSEEDQLPVRHILDDTRAPQHGGGLNVHTQQLLCLGKHHGIFPASSSDVHGNIRTGRVIGRRQEQYWVLGLLPTENAAHPWVETGEDDLPLVGVSVDRLEDDICHHVPLKVVEIVLWVLPLWYWVLDLNVEADVAGQTLEHLLQGGEGHALWTLLYSLPHLLRVPECFVPLGARGRLRFRSVRGGMGAGGGTAGLEPKDTGVI